MPDNKPRGCLAAIFGLFGGDGAGSTGAAARVPYRREKWLFSKAERSFFGVLEQAVAITPAGSQRLRIFAKVRLCDLLSLGKCESWQSHWNRIQSKHVDFVLCTYDEIQPVLVIELDDSSHEREDRKQRDTFVDAALAAAGLPLLRVTARASYNVAEVRAAVVRQIARESKV
jgi:hypothetical protein